MTRRLDPKFSLALALAGLLVASCHAAPLAIAPVDPPSRALSHDQIMAALEAKPNSTWQDGNLAGYAPLRAWRQAHRYRVNASALPGAVWSSSVATLSSSAPAFAHVSLSYNGPTPATGDAVYVATEAPQGSPNLFKLDAGTGAVTNGSGWDALVGLASPGTIKRSGVMLSGDNKRLYLFTSGGFLIVLNAATGSQIFAKKLSNSGFANTSPTLDMSNGGGYPAIGSDENVYAVSNDGSVYRVHVTLSGTTTNVAITPFPASNGTDKPLWGAVPTIAYGAAVTVNAPPVAWNSQVFFGDTSGKCYRVDVSSGSSVLTTWRPDLLTSAPNKAITAAPAWDFDAAGVNVGAIFVPCGDRLVWIDPAYSPAADAAVASPPLVVDQTTPTQGLLSGYSYSGTAVKGPYDDIDWISIAGAANPTPTIWGGGATNKAAGRLFGAAGYSNPTDGDEVRGYMQFSIPANDYAGATPIAARLDLSAATTTGSNENLNLYRASNFQAGTTSFWTGYAGTPNVDWNNRPSLLSGVIGNYSGPVSASSATTGAPRYSVNFSDQLPSDQPNIPGFSTAAYYAYAMVSQGKQFGGTPASTQAAEWCKGIDPGTNVTEPALYVTVANGAQMPAGNGMRCQPTFDSQYYKVWVTGSNAVYELSYANRTDFQTKSKVTYNLTAAGRGTSGTTGPVTSGTPKTYQMPKGNLLYTGNRLIAVDQDTSTNRFFLNDFAAPLSTTTDQLGYYFDGGAGSASIGEALIYDYISGSAYATTGSKKVVRVDIQ